MNPTELEAQAKQAATQGQQMESQDQSTAANSQTAYNNYSGQANQATQQEQAEAQYMQGAGSGGNQYNSELQTLQSQYAPNLNGYISDQLSSLSRLNGEFNSANNQFNTPGGVGAYGMSAPALASYEGSILAPLQTGQQTANNNLSAANTALGTLETGASQYTTNQVQSEQNAAIALGQSAQQYQTQAAAALQNMQFYNQLASSQGGLNAQQAQSYATAYQAYNAAQQAAAQAALFNAQTKGQLITNTGNQNTLNAQTAKQQQAAAQVASNNEYNAMGGSQEAKPLPAKASPSVLSDIVNGNSSMWNKLNGIFS